MIRVKFFANFREATGVKETDLQTPRNVRTLLSELIEKFGPKLTEELYEPNTPKSRDHVLILVNGRNLKLSGGLDAPLKDNDVIAIFPPVAGG